MSIAARGLSPKNGAYVQRNGWPDSVGYSSLKKFPSKSFRRVDTAGQGRTLFAYERSAEPGRRMEPTRRSNHPLIAASAFLLSSIIPTPIRPGDHMYIRGDLLSLRFNNLPG